MTPTHPFLVERIAAFAPGLMTPIIGTLKYFDTAVHSAIASVGAAQNGAAVPKIEAAAPYVPTWKFEWIAPPETPQVAPAM